MSIACPTCRLVVQLRCDDLAATLPGLTVGEVVGRLRCSRCGTRPSSVVLADGASGMGTAVVRHVELLGDGTTKAPPDRSSGALEN